MEHEDAFVSTFVVPEKRARYANFLANPKQRGKITDRFCHCFDFVPALARQVPRGPVGGIGAIAAQNGSG
jgi:hypothetical protein